MSEGTIPFASRDGMVTGVLNWNAASRYSYEDENYLDVPFVFDGKEYMTSQGTDQSLKFNLVFRNNANGDIEAALRTSFRIQTDGENGDARSAKAYDTYMLMNGDAATVWIDEGQNHFKKRRPLSYAEARRIENSRMAAMDCSTVMIYKTSVSCYTESGPQTPTTCIISTSVTYVTSCDEGGGLVGNGGGNDPAYWPPPRMGNTGGSPGAGSDRDKNGYLNNRILELRAVLDADPDALLPCDSLNIMPYDRYGAMWQHVAQFKPSHM